MSRLVITAAAVLLIATPAAAAEIAPRLGLHPELAPTLRLDPEIARVVPAFASVSIVDQGGGAEEESPFDVDLGIGLGMALSFGIPGVIFLASGDEDLNELGTVFTLVGLGGLGYALLSILINSMGGR